MVKKITHIIFAIVLLVASMGFTVSKHYCHNHLVSTAIDKEAESCGMNGNCCKTETVLMQLNEDAVTNATLTVPANVVTSIQPLAVIHLLSLLVDVQTLEEIFHEYISPPPRTIQTVLSKIQTYLL